MHTKYREKRVSMGFQVAIDGPAGAGKSTIAKLIAKRLGYIYVDTGAMYRAMALFMIKENVDGSDKEMIEKMCEKAFISIEFENGEQIVTLNGENVNAFIRTEEVGKMASVTSVNAKVREKLVSLQQQLAAKCDVVMDGRDIGTVVLPDAYLKIYLTASAEVRAHRRMDELVAKGQECDYEVILKDIIERDERDMNREISPLKQADDAILLDSSYMTIDEVATKVISMLNDM